MFSLVKENKVNSLIGRAYNARTFHCYHLVQELTNAPDLEVTVRNKDIDIPASLSSFVQLKERKPGCIALIGPSHIGVYLDKENIIHCDTPGVRIETVVQLLFKYPYIRYYEYKSGVKP